ncbi:hypothetical protein ABLE91_02130 [Aquabacter sp. CN5-332]|uniref:hypothetical protein n=1 Tax=Aquabacter sp. CN5-332 TaxID=3156608 RepID=UPI0032B5632D
MPPDDDLIWRPLGAADLDRVEALHRAVMAGLGPEVVKPETRDFLADMLGPRGRMVGVFAGEALVAYGVLQHHVPASDDPRAAIGLPFDVPLMKLAGASVALAYRGRGLQRALIAARVRLALDGVAGTPPILFATSAPANSASWGNLLAEGFAIRAIKPYYGGHLRYVMVRNTERMEQEGHMLLDASATQEQAALLAAGWRGVALRDGPSGPSLAFARPAAKP